MKDLSKEKYLPMLNESYNLLGKMKINIKIKVKIVSDEIGTFIA